MSLSYIPAPPAARALKAPSEPQIEVAGQPAAFAKDQEIFGEGEAALHIFKVRSGAVRTFRVLSDGRRQIADFYLPGDVFGVEAGVERSCSAEALTDTVVTVASRARLAEDEADTARALWRLAIKDLHRSHEHVLTLGRRNALERVASFLTDIAERMGAEDDIALPMTRQDMADYLGLTIETVSRTLSQLQASGVIRVGAGRALHVCDRSALSVLCD
ncbi:MAG TPA: helix-turn-helix domain-containing protein [Caulobacteraceae bacterium]|nr:helix-turn-helix domain-containing protein [Caulobacteraceae bacterium]